jgi:hypothetical protein
MIYLLTFIWIILGAILSNILGTFFLFVWCITPLIILGVLAKRGSPKKPNLVPLELE